MILEKSFDHYKRNFKAALAFALLLVFVPVFAMLENVFIGSGIMFVDYSLGQAAPFFLFLPAFLLFLVFYSLLVSVMVFSVRKDLSKLKINFYLQEMIQKFAWKVFLFFALYSILLYAVVLVLLLLGLGFGPIALALLAVSLLLFFVPQAIVVDEEGLFHAVQNNLEFIFHNPKGFLQVLVVGCALLAAISIVGEIIDLFYPVGEYVSLLLVLVFVLPFLETMKTHLYMFKFNLVKSPQMLSQPGGQKK